jgi:hypothetical protein
MGGVAANAVHGPDAALAGSAPRPVDVVRR